MIHIPLLRWGRPYRSLDVAQAPHFRTGEPVAELSQANLGLIRRDLLAMGEAKERLNAIPAAELIRITQRAASLFAEDSLPLGDGSQAPQDYVDQVSSTTGLPHVMVRRNLEKIRGVMARVDEVLAGLTRGLDLTVLDSGFGEADAGVLSYFPHAESLGVVLPSNSPGVHSLWVPAFALKTPLVLKPGSAEPWSPYRILQALIAAGAPPEAFCYFPAEHAGGAEILRRCGRGMVFGDLASTKPWQHDPRVEVHGPGYSKIVLGDDAADHWEEYLDVMAASIAENSGRSCVNASGVWTPRHAEAIAQALASRLARIEPRPAEDPDAEIAPFANRAVAERIDRMVNQDLEGARDVTAQFRSGSRLAEAGGCAYLLPTIVRCAPDHPLANREFLFPFASVVETPPDSMPAILGPSLVVTAITSDPKFARRLLGSRLIGRLNLGPIPTTRIAWDQPHEGNLFEHLYGRRALQRTADLAMV